MALVLADRVRDTTTTTGTGTVTLSGTAPTGYQTFGAAIGNGNTTYYTINAGSQWEVGLGTYSSTGPSLARTTVLASSNGGSLVDFSTGTKDVFVTYPAEEAVYQDGTAIKAGTSILGVTNGGTGTNTTFTAGSVVFAGASGVYSQDNANLFWDNSNDRLGIGTASPGSPLDVQTNSSALGISLRGRSSDNVSSLAVRSNDGATIYGQVQGRSTDFRLEASSSNIMTMYTNSTERMRIDSSGNLLVGGTTALGKIYLEGDTNGSINTWIRNNNSGSSARAGVVLNAFGNSWSMGMGSSANNGNALTWVVDVGGANTERMRIDSSGNVGIGTSSPSSRLTITGGNTEIRDGNYLLLRPSGNAWDMRLQATGTQLDILSGGALGSPIMSLLNGGNVGIGTSSPGSKLSVNGDASFGDSIFMGTGVSTGDCKIELGSNRSAAGNAYIDFHALAGQDYNGRLIRTSGANGSFEITNAGTGAMTFSTNNGERMRIDGSGNFLWNRSSTGSETTTDGVTFFKNASGGGTVSYFTNGGTGSAVAIGVQADTNTLLFFRSGTQVGSVSVTTTATAYNTSSDYRLKDIDGPVANSGAYIDALKPVQGSWKADGSRFIGLLAHEVQEVSETPIATGEKDGEEMQAMDYSAPELIANLIAEIQSLRARVAQLEGN